MGLPMRQSECTTFIGLDIGHDIVELGRVKAFEGLARFLLQRCAKRTSRIMDLHHGVYALTDAAYVLLSRCGTHRTDGKHRSASAHRQPDHNLNGA